jgi:outer membrane protein assembly factor BamB
MGPYRKFRLMHVTFGLAALLWGWVGSPEVLHAHDGDVIPVFKYPTAPVFNVTGPSPRGCNVSGIDGYRPDTKIHLDNDVTVFIQRTDTDLYFCFVGIEPRPTDPLTEPNHRDTVWVFLDIDHEGSSPPTKRDYLFEISPTSLVTVSGTTLSGPQFKDPGPPQDSGPPDFRTTWRIAGVDASAGEFVVTWNAELRVSRTLFGGWHTVGARFAYNQGIPFVTHKFASWPAGSDPLKPSTWADLDLGESVRPLPGGVYTNNNNNARTGAYYEKVLNPGNVNAGAINTFGKLYTWDVEGQIYAQPLYVHGLTLPDGSSHNVVYVATQKNWVYAFDADTHATLWSTSLGDPIPVSDTGCSGHPKLLYPWIGITSTPVIDPESETIYLVTHNKEDGNYFHRLHALDLRTRAEKFRGPVDITASVPGNADDNKNGVIVFDKYEQPDQPRQLNRPGLLLQNGLLYIGFGSYCDVDKYHGWVMAYDVQTLQQKDAFNTTPDGKKGAIWQSGRGLVADAWGNVFLMTSNGERYDAKINERDLIQSFVRLRSDLKFPDWFTAKSHDCGNDVYPDQDLDFGSSGPLLVAARSGAGADNRILGGGKDGSLYLVKAMDMGKNAHPPLHQIIATRAPEWEFTISCQSKPIETGTRVHHIHGGPVLWDEFNDGQELVYLLGENDPLKVFRIRNDQIEGPMAQSKYHAPPGMPGGTLSLSYSEDPNNAIIWVNIPRTDSAYLDIVEGELIAFKSSPNQGDLPLLWHSEIEPNHRDRVGLYAKFVPPTIADGKVFVASFGDPQDKDDETRKGWLHVYGLGPPPPR